MKRALFIVLALTAWQVSADQYVNSYTRSDGTYVQGYWRGEADGYKWNNKKQESDSGWKSQSRQDSGTRYIGGYESPDPYKPQYIGN